MNVRRFFSRWQNLLGLAIVALFISMAAAAPVLAPPPENAKEFSVFRSIQDTNSKAPIPPGQGTIMGTVATGLRGTHLDVFYTLVWGTRSALRFGLLVALSTALVGVLLGAFSAFMGGWVNNLVMRVTDAFLAFPIIVGVVVFEQLLRVSDRMNTIALISGSNEVIPPSKLEILLSVIDPVMLALILFSWMPYARLVNTLVLGVKQTDFVQAARALGASNSRIILRHLVPNSISPAIVLGARDIGGMVLMQATLTFIGMGGGSEWGELLAIGRRWIIAPGGNPMTYWWVFVPITLALVLFGIGWNLLGDGLNDWLNPRQN
ncbi:MAG: ABC transporter permease [Chloroflexota bacterium]